MRQHLSSSKLSVRRNLSNYSFWPIDIRPPDFQPFTGAACRQDTFADALVADFSQMRLTPIKLLNLFPREFAPQIEKETPRDGHRE